MNAFAASRRRRVWSGGSTLSMCRAKSGPGSPSATTAPSAGKRGVHVLGQVRVVQRLARRGVPDDEEGAVAVGQGHLVHRPGGANLGEQRERAVAVVVAPVVERSCAWLRHQYSRKPEQTRSMRPTRPSCSVQTTVWVRTRRSASGSNVELVVHEHPVADVVAGHVGEHDGVVAPEPVVEPCQHGVTAVLLDRAAGKQGAQPDLVGQMGAEPVQGPVGDSRGDRGRQGVRVHEASLVMRTFPAPRWSVRWAARSAASARAPSMYVERRRRSMGRPST